MLSPHTRTDGSIAQTQSLYQCKLEEKKQNKKKRNRVNHQVVLRGLSHKTVFSDATTQRQITQFASERDEQIPSTNKQSLDSQKKKKKVKHDFRLRTVATTLVCCVSIFTQLTSPNTPGFLVVNIQHV